MESRLNVPEDHVIVDLDEWEVATKVMAQLLDLEDRIRREEFWTSLSEERRPQSNSFPRSSL